MIEETVSRKAVDTYLENLNSPKFLHVAHVQYPSLKSASDIYASSEMEIEIWGDSDSLNVKAVRIIGAKPLYPALMVDIHALDSYNEGEPDRCWFVVGKTAAASTLSKLPCQVYNYNGSEKACLFSSIWLHNPIEEGFFNKLLGEINTLITYQDKFPEVMRNDFRKVV